MRRTQQNADPQRRRGIRSRLVACVAAVAMLVTSVAAGTAVATELGGGDVADQTTQNTMTLEQQGSGDTGDGDQATTNSDGQADGSQPSDVDNDTKDSEGTVGDGATAKRAASVPTPQAADLPSVQALGNEDVVDVPSTNDKVHVKLFDYDTDGHTNVNTNKKLQFGATGAPATGNGTGLNQYTGWRNGVNQGLVKENLSDGYPTLTGENGQSLQYLFDPQSEAAGVDVQNNGQDVDGLFQVDTDGYYHYDSRYNFASYSEGTGTFKLYDTGRFPQIKSQHGNNYSSLTDDDPLPGDSEYGGAFMPFNDLAGNANEIFTYQNRTWKGYKLAGGNSTANYSFGMTVETQFYMPKDGKVNGQDMVFEFSGDDDVWVFVDGKLVLDLGGIHDDFGGSINFADGTATVSKVYGKNSEQTRKLDNILDDDWDEFGSQHTLKVFYLERGAGGSNCKFRFNLPTISSDAINVGKQITDSNTADFTTAQFTMKVEVDYNGGDHKDAEKFTGSYEVIDMDTNQVVDTRTTTDGTFTIGQGQYASLKPDGGFGPDTEYRVTELTADNYDDSDYEFSLRDTNMVDHNSGDDQTGTVGQSKWLNVITDTYYLIVNNKFKAKDKYSFTVSKRMADGQDAGSTLFDLKVTDGQGHPYTGNYFLKNGETLNDEPQSAEDGVIALRAGQSAVITDVDPGTTFKVEEIELPSGYEQPTYTCTTDGEDTSCDTVVVNKTNTNPTITVTNTLDQLDPPVIHKKIGHDRKDDGSFDGDSYTLALDVMGDTSTTQTQSTTPLDIVLVLDVSGSMDQQFGEAVETYTPIYGEDVQGSIGHCSTIGNLQINCKQDYKYDGNYYALVNGEYVQIWEKTTTVESSLNLSEYKQHDSWMLNGRTVVPKSSAEDESEIQFYQLQTKSQSKMDALKTAVNGFIDSAAAYNSTVDAAKQHRISLVKFADDSYKSNVGNDYHEPDRGTSCSPDDKCNYTQVVSGFSNDANALKDAVNGLYPGGSTAADYGLKLAQDVLAGGSGASGSGSKSGYSGTPSREDAKKVVVLFTDGEPNHGSGFDGEVASDAVNSARNLKQDATVYTVGVFNGADTSDPADNTSDFNKYMHAVSSNYPDARVGYSWYDQWNESDDFDDLDFGDRVSKDSRYYLKADDPDGLDQVFQDIYESESSTNGYTNVSIVDQLSNYAQLNEGIKWDSTAVSSDGFYRVTANDNLIWLEVTDANGDPVQSVEDGYPPYTLWYNPKSKTVKADLGAELLRDGWTYTLKFKIRPTQKAYDDYAENLRNGDETGYDDVMGDPGTDLNTEQPTSSNLPGFHSNKEAYVEYDANGKTGQQEQYPNPVLQVEDTSITVTKNWDGIVPTDVYKVTVQLQDEDGVIATIDIDCPVKSDQSWVGTFEHVAPGHTYTITETKLDGYGDPTIAYTENGRTVESLAVETDDVWPDSKTLFVTTVTNSPAPKSYDIGEHLGLHKQLDGADLKPGMFQFELELVSAKAPDDTDITDAMTLPNTETVSNGDVNGDGLIDEDEEEASVFDFGEISFAKPGTYVLKVTESQDTPTTETGRYVFDEHALYVRYTVEQNAETGALDITAREVATSTDENPDLSTLGWKDANIGETLPDGFADDYLTWHNMYVAPVSALPLTGGDSTARSLLLVGSGVLLVAGVAWLLARRRRV